MNTCTLVLTANENSKITDKLRYLSIISKHKHLFLDIFESSYNHRQMPANIKIKSHIQQKNWENCVSMKKVCSNNKNFFCRFDRGCLFFNEFSVWFRITRLNTIQSNDARNPKEPKGTLKSSWKLCNSKEMYKVLRSKEPFRILRN